MGDLSIYPGGSSIGPSDDRPATAHAIGLDPLWNLRMGNLVRKNYRLQNPDSTSMRWVVGAQELESQLLRELRSENSCGMGSISWRSLRTTMRKNMAELAMSIVEQLIGLPWSVRPIIKAVVFENLQFARERPALPPKADVCSALALAVCHPIICPVTF